MDLAIKILQKEIRKKQKEINMLLGHGFVSNKNYGAKIATKENEIGNLLDSIDWLNQY